LDYSFFALSEVRTSFCYNNKHSLGVLRDTLVKDIWMNAAAWQHCCLEIIYVPKASFEVCKAILASNGGKLCIISGTKAEILSSMQRPRKLVDADA
jgi:hypothetical protein